MQTVKLIPMQREVLGRSRHGNPATYRWAPGYLLVLPNGNHLYPPVSMNEAKELARGYYSGELKFEVQR